MPIMRVAPASAAAAPIALSNSLEPAAVIATADQLHFDVMFRAEPCGGDGKELVPVEHREQHFVIIENARETRPSPAPVPATLRLPATDPIARIGDRADQVVVSPVALIGSLPLPRIDPVDRIDSPSPGLHSRIDCHRGVGGVGNQPHRTDP
jgi:hypothetical protein